MFPGMDYDALIDGVAAELKIPVTTRKKWRQRGVPYRRRDDIREIAGARGISIPREAFDAFGRAAPPPDATPSEAA